MWAEVLAIYAAVVSTGSLGVSYLVYRSGGPQLSGKAEIYGRYDSDGPTLLVDVHNRGRGAITLDSVGLIGIGFELEREFPEFPVGTWPLRSPSCVLPLRMEGHSGAHWYFSAHDITTIWINRKDLNLIRLEVEIHLANGDNLILKVDTTSIDALIGRNLPDRRRKNDEPSERPSGIPGQGQAGTGNERDPDL